MFEGRMLDKTNEPNIDEIRDWVSESFFEYINIFEDRLNERYDLKKELKFPFGNDYGWSFKYSHKSKYLAYLFFEKNFLTITLQ